MNIALSRFVLECQASTALAFPEQDCGYRGSAWHGRIDNAVRRSAALSPLLKGSPDTYWVDAEESFRSDNLGPFGDTQVAEGTNFSFAMVCAGKRALSHPRLMPDIHEMAVSAGTSDRAGFFGSFRVLRVTCVPFPLSALQPGVQATTKDASLALTLHFDTMMRLGEGDHLQMAQEVLTQGHSPTPRLHALVERVITRARTLELCDAAAYLEWLERLSALSVEFAQALPVLRSSVVPYDVKRLSAKAQTHHPIGGLLGSVTYGGPETVLRELSPLFVLAEWIRIGRKTGLGLGRIRSELSLLPNRVVP
jgi:hypothetical protein